MAVNLFNKYSTKLDERFSQKSLTEAWCGHDYDFDGVNSITVLTANPMAMHNYGVAANGTAVAANRYTGGIAPDEVQDEAATYALRKGRSFGGTVDITNSQDQMDVKKANRLLKQQWDEVVVPEIDAYRLSTWANGAGSAVINSTALTNQTIIRQLLVGGSVLNNHHAARENRVCFVTETMAVETKLASELNNNESYTSKAIINGEIARMNGMSIVAVPDDYMPAGVEFMIKWKRASADPMKLRKLLVHKDPPGVGGSLMEGLVRYDSFVLAQKAYGIYVYGQSGIVAQPTASLSSSKIALATTTAGATIKYTTDGSNPKTSPTAQTYSTTLTVESGKTLRAYAFKSGMLNSGILSVLEDNVT